MLIVGGSDVNATTKVIDHRSGLIEQCGHSHHGLIMSSLLGCLLCLLCDAVFWWQHNHAPLHLASQHGCLGAGRVLLELGADIHAVSGIGGWTALHKAADFGHAELIDLLIEEGAEVNVTGGANVTPLHLAAQNGHLPCVDALIAWGAALEPKRKVSDEFSSRGPTLAIFSLPECRGALLTRSYAVLCVCVCVCGIM